MEKDKYGHNVNEHGVEFKVSTSSSGKGTILILRMEKLKQYI